MKIKFKIPKTLNIFGLRISVEVSNDMPSNAAGLYEPYEAKIKIHPDHPNKQEFMHTLLHEAGHAMFYRISINQAVSKEVHEFIVDNFATMLLDNFNIEPKVK